jgi:hypothetical protein
MSDSFEDDIALVNPIHGPPIALRNRQTPISPTIRVAKVKRDIGAAATISKASRKRLRSAFGTAASCANTSGGINNDILDVR